MLKKGLSVFVLSAMWLCLTGFSSLGGSDENSLNSVMEQTEQEHVDELLEAEEWSGKVMAKVEDSVSVRAEASTEAAVVGKMFRGNAGDIVQQSEGWTQIQSGNVLGWVSDEYLAFGSEAEERAALDVAKVATVTTETLKVRAEANTECEVIDLIGMGETIEVGEEQDGWLEIVYSDGEKNYISAEYVEVDYQYGQAKTIEEIEAEEAARKAAEEKAKRTTNLGAIAASTDDVTLLAALIQAEGGNQPYEGQLGVGAVVMNRVRSGSYPNSIQAVISAPGQFGPAATGQVASIMAAGPKASCMQAAQAAINGETTVGTATHFRNVKSGYSGIVIGNHVFW